MSIFHVESDSAAIFLIFLRVRPGSGSEQNQLAMLSVPKLKVAVGGRIVYHWIALVEKLLQKNFQTDRTCRFRDIPRQSS
jgi:hypothetical protein